MMSVRDADRRGPNEPSYRPIGLEWSYWSDLGSEEGLEFLRKREPTVEEVTAWLDERGFEVTPRSQACPSGAGGPQDGTEPPQAP